MVSNLDKQRLNSAITSAISESVQANGFAIHSDVKARVVANQGEVLARISAELADSQVGTMVTSHLRSWSKVKITGATQLLLPGVPAAVLEHMPVLITVPADGADLSDDHLADRPETRHVALDRASVGELRRYWKFIEAHLKAVEKRFNATGFIVRRCEGASDETTVMEALKARAAGRSAA